MGYDPAWKEKVLRSKDISKVLRQKLALFDRTEAKYQKTGNEKWLDKLEAIQELIADVRAEIEGRKPKPRPERKRVSVLERAKAMREWRESLPQNLMMPDHLSGGSDSRYRKMKLETGRGQIPLGGVVDSSGLE